MNVTLSPTITWGRRIGVVGGVLVAVACSSSSTGTGTSSGTSGTTVGPETCEAPCEACSPYVCPCADGTSVRGCACSDDGTCGDAQLCANGRACAENGGNASSSSSSSSGSSGSSGTSSSGSSGSTDCVSLGQTGCSSVSGPSCCTDAEHPAVACNANNDGEGNAQCCVNSGKACTQASDCCGYPTNPTLVDCCSGKCGLGC